ncbi:elongation factor Tu C-terminal domain protein, partial [Chlamydia psittaci 84-8471/1]
TISKIIA